jgi:hypothetical protein
MKVESQTKKIQAETDFIAMQKQQKKKNPKDTPGVPAEIY